MYIIKSPSRSKYDSTLYLKQVSLGSGMSFWTSNLDESKVYESIGGLLYQVPFITDVDPGARERWQIVRVEQSGLKEVEVL